MPAPSQSRPVRVAGVPEHMNVPLRRAIESGTIARHTQVRSTWKDEPAGTGALAAALDRGELDLATMLTEGAVAAIARGARFRIVSWWLTSPLLWGIHAHGRDASRSVRDFRHPRCAISRLGSGSHLMAYVMAAQEGLELGEFVIVHGVDGARRALAAGEAELFLWERAMTSPFVESGEFARIGELPTAWPSFVFAASDDALLHRRSELRDIVRIAQRQAERFASQRGAATLLSELLHIPHDEAAAWLRTARWARDTTIDPRSLQPVQDALVSVGALSTNISETALVHRIDEP